eukprot:528723-Pyramimonas_sp.AAC.1
MAPKPWEHPDFLLPGGLLGVVFGPLWEIGGARWADLGPPRAHRGSIAWSSPGPFYCLLRPSRGQSRDHLGPSWALLGRTRLCLPGRARSCPRSVFC